MHIVACSSSFFFIYFNIFLICNKRHLTVLYRFFFSKYENKLDFNFFYSIRLKTIIVWIPKYALNFFYNDHGRYRSIGEA